MRDSKNLGWGIGLVLLGLFVVITQGTMDFGNASTNFGAALVWIVPLGFGIYNLIKYARGK